MFNKTADLVNELASSTESLAEGILSWALVLAAVAAVTVAVLELLKGLVRARLFFHRRKLEAWMPEEAPRDLMIELAVGSQDPRALYNQRTETMTSNILSVAVTVIENPKEFPDLFKALVGRSTTGLLPGNADRLDPATAKRFRRLVTRKIDAFRLDTEYRWMRWNQILAVVGAIVLLTFLLCDSAIDPATKVVIAILGGVLSPLAKDLAVALAGLRVRT